MLPEGLETEVVEDAHLRVWNAVVTNVSEADNGGLHIDITIRNDTGDRSEMSAAAAKPAVLTTSDGETVNCDTVFIGTGGHRLAPGFQMRGYTTGDGTETQLLYVECADAAAASGSTLFVDYVSYTGNRDYYDQEAGKAEGQLELNLDEVAQSLIYPIGTPVEGLAIEPGVELIALSDNIITLQDVQRSETGFQFTWQNFTGDEIRSANPHRHPAHHWSGWHYLWRL